MQAAEQTEKPADCQSVFSSNFAGFEPGKIARPNRRNAVYFPHAFFRASVLPRFRDYGLGVFGDSTFYFR
jgi:hypothetical protein